MNNKNEELETNAEIAGFIATEERTLPGYLHDTFSSWHPMFVSGPAYASTRSSTGGCGSYLPGAPGRTRLGDAGRALRPPPPGGRGRLRPEDRGRQLPARPGCAADPCRAVGAA
jgi:hypothetical protein